MISDSALQELELLKQFSETRLQRGSFVYDKVQDVISQAHRELTKLKASESLPSATYSSSTNMKLTIFFKFNGCIDESFQLLEVPASTSLDAFKVKIESSFRVGSCKLSQIIAKRTKTCIKTFDSSSLKFLGLKEGDELLAEMTQSFMSNIESPILSRFANYGISAETSLETVALIFHGTFLNSNFIPVVEQPSTVAGFAPSLKELPKGVILPNNWNSDKESIALMYKHKSKVGKIYQFTCLVLDEFTAVATLVMRNGASKSVEVAFPNFVVSSGKVFDTVNEQDLVKLALDLVSPFVSVLATNTLPSAQDTQPAAACGNLPPVAPLPPSVTPLQGGSVDLDPFPGGIHIGGPGHLPVGGNNPFSSGSLIGPNNSIFNPPDMDIDNMYGEDQINGIVPGARFDPIGPVFGPNSGNGNAGIHGGIHGGRGYHGRGRGRGAAPLYMGEPNPDHLCPPGW